MLGSTISSLAGDGLLFRGDQTGDRGVLVVSRAGVRRVVRVAWPLLRAGGQEQAPSV